MSEIAPTPPRRTFVSRLAQNPVALKELRSRMRGRRAFVVLTVYLTLMSAIISLVYLVYASQSNQPFGPDTRQAGTAIFASVLMVQAFLVVMMAPAFTAGAISGEKERQTYDLLRTTLLPARSLVLGKLMSALAYVLLLVLAAVPLQSVAFFLGGIDWIELVVSQALILVSAVTFALLGLYASSAMRSTIASSVLTYALSLLLVAGAPVLAMMILPFGSAFFFGGAPTGPPPWVEAALAMTALLVASTNLPITLIVSEVFLVQESALFYFRTTIGGYTLYLPSPWWIYLLLYTLLALFLYWRTVRRVQKVPTR